MSFEESLILHASPTLASIKVANLYNFKFTSKSACSEIIKQFNALMNPNGLYVELLRSTDDFYLIYVYRKSHLIREIKNRKIRDFLKEYGYEESDDISDYIRTLKTRLDAEEEEFPHEIGIFLGYPLEDVKSYIATKGRNCVMCGEWKVYHDEQYARCMFCKYNHCKDVYLKVYKDGRRFCDMMVSA